MENEAAKGQKLDKDRRSRGVIVRANGHSMLQRPEDCCGGPAAAPSFHFPSYSTSHHFRACPRLKVFFFGFFPYKS